MNIFFKTRILVFLGLCTLISTNAIGAEQVKVRFVSFPKSEDPQPIELALAEGKTMQVDLPTNSISEPYDVPATSIWALGKSSKNEDGTTSFKTYGKSNATEASEQLILVIRKGKQDSDGLILYTINYTDKDFGGGKYYLVNATTFDVAGTLGTTKFLLKPGDLKMITPEPSKVKEGNQYLFTEIFCRKNDEIKPFFSSTWRYSEKARCMVFFYQRPDSNKLDLHTIRKF